MRIERDGGELRYFDINGDEIEYGDYVMMDGKKEKVYMTEDGELGLDATNPRWIETGRAVPCEYGVYPFVRADNPVLVEKGRKRRR